MHNNQRYKLFCFKPITVLIVLIIIQSILLSFSVFAQPGTGRKKGKKDSGVRLKDLARIAGVRSNQLLGYGLVVGLPGTGDSRSKLADQSVRNLLGNLGQKMPTSDLHAKNIAAVLVTAEILPFARRGDRQNVIVSSIGDARSLEGGVLIQTPLQGGNGKIYAVAQGVITTGGRGKTRGQRRTGKTVGVVLNGAHIEREPKTNFATNRRISVSLNRFDFATLNEVKKSVIKAFPGLKPVTDGGALTITIPKAMDPVAFIAKLEQIRLQPKYRARVVINERTGTIVMGGDIKVDPVSISRGGMKLFITGQGVSTGVSKELQIKYGSKSKGKKKTPVTRAFSGTSISEVIEALNAMGAGVRDIIAILEAIRDSGALHAEIIVI